MDEWQPTPVFLPGSSHGQRSLGGSSTKGKEELIESSYVDFTTSTDLLPEVIHYLSDISVSGTDFDVKLIKEDNINYIMLPSHSDLSALNINFTADSTLGEINGEISGDKGKSEFITKTE